MRADAPATRRSHHAASSTPPATHQPSMAAITGLDELQAGRARAVRCRAAAAGRGGWRPAENACSSPVSTATRWRVVGVEGQELVVEPLRPSRCSRRCGRAPWSIRTTTTPSGSSLVAHAPDRTWRPRYRRRRCASSRDRPGAAARGPGGRRPPDPRPTACARPPSTPSAASARSPRPPCSTSSPGAARWGSRRCRGAPPGPPSSTRDLARPPGHRGEPGDVRARRRGRGGGDARPSGSSPAPGSSAGGTWPCSTRPTTTTAGPSCCSTCPRTTAVLESSRGRRSALRVGGRAGQALRAHPRGDRPAASSSDALTWLVSRDGAQR